jgi:hypothetical protein
MSRSLTAVLQQQPAAAATSLEAILRGIMAAITMSMSTGETEEVLKYCNIVAGSVAAAAETFPKNTLAAAAPRAQMLQQQPALQALMLACLKTAAALAAKAQQDHSWGHSHVDVACSTVEASVRMAKQQLAFAGGTDAAAAHEAAAHKRPAVAAAAAAAEGPPVTAAAAAAGAAGAEVSEPGAAAGACVAADAATARASLVSWQDPAASWVLLLARGLVVAGQLLLQQQADRERQIGGKPRCLMPWHDIQTLIAAFRWLQQQLPNLQLPGGVAAVEQASSSSSGSNSNKQHQQLLAQAEQLQEVLAQNSRQEMLIDCDWQRQMVQQLVAFGQSLCYALPSRACCNNPGCSNLARLTERELVSGKGCVCSR